MKKNHFIGIASFLVFISLIWIIATPFLFPAVKAEDITAAHPGFTAPPFSLSTPANEAASLSDFEGQPVLILFWASWCSVCKSIMPGLQNVYQEFSSTGFEILAVNATYQDNLPFALSYFDSHSYTFTLLLDQDGAVSQNYQVRALPTAVLINPYGVIEHVVIGSALSEGYLRSALQTIQNERE